MLPTFIGIGAPKAGTTWLSNVLEDHPGVCMSAQKEPDYFSYKYDNSSISYYQGLFSCDSGSLAAGEFSTGYLADPNAASRIANDLPDVKLIAVLRNPVAQIYSHYWHLQRQNFHTGDANAGRVSFEEALKHYEHRLIRPALYADHLERWLSLFDRDRFLIHLFEALKEDPDGVVRSTYEFIGVDSNWLPRTAGNTGTEARQGTSPRNAFAARAGGRVYAALNRYAYMPLKRMIGEERAATIKETLRVRPLLESTFRRKGYPPMRSGTRRLLIERFEEPNRRLAMMLGRDLEHWNR